MGFSTTERINMFMKSLMSGVIDANASAVWYETFTPFGMISEAQNIWTQISSIPAAGNLSTARTNATNNPTLIQDLSQNASAIRLTPVSGTNNSTYIAYSTYNDTSSAVLTNWLQPQLVLQSSGAPSNGYAVNLYDGDPGSGGTLVSTSAGQTGTGESTTVGWVWNYAKGLLLLSADFKSSVSNPYVVGFRYIGSTAASADQTTLVAGETIAVGEVVRLVLNGEGGTPGRAVKARANSVNGSGVVGVATSGASSGSSFSITQVGAASLKFGSAPASSSNGVSVYLSDGTSGLGVLTAPTSSGSTVVRLGKLQGATGATSTPTVLFNPHVEVILG